MKNSKELASWLPNISLFLKQLCVSLLSYITLPFFRVKENGILLFFQNNYYVEPDGLVFDGSTTGYFSKIHHLLDLESLSEMEVIDLGCGQGALYKWFRKNNVFVKRYIGIDFSIKYTQLDDLSFLVCDDINNIRKYLSDKKTVITLCNSLCYINDDIFSAVLNSLCIGTHIAIIEPSPNLFWDAHFNGIRPIYRSQNSVCEYLRKHGFMIESVTSDFLFRLGDIYCSKLSYGIYAYKMG